MCFAGQEVWGGVFLSCLKALTIVVRSDLQVVGSPLSGELADKRRFEVLWAVMNLEIRWRGAVYVGESTSTEIAIMTFALSDKRSEEENGSPQHLHLRKIMTA